MMAEHTFVVRGGARRGMRAFSCALAALGLAGILFQAGCVTPPPTPRPVVYGPPPAPIYEVVPAPRPHWVWISGHWTLAPRGYVWHPGHWRAVL